MEDNNGYVYTLLHIWYIMDGCTVLVYSQGQIQDFKGGSQGNGYIKTVVYIFHIIILNKVHCNLLKAIDA